MAVTPVNSVRSATGQPANIPKSALHTMAIGMRAGTGINVIGYVTKIARTHTRKMKHLYQLEPYPGYNSNTWGSTDVLEEYPKSNYYPGETVEVVPGPLEDETVSLTKYCLFTSTLFEAFLRVGSPDGTISTSGNAEDTKYRLVSLLEQVRPIDLYEIWVSPVSGEIIYGIEYQDCWFKELGHTADITGDHVIAMDATLDVTRTRPMITTAT